MYQKTTNKLTALLLTLVMLLALIPAVSLTAYATGTTVTTKTELMNAVKQSGTVILGADIVLTDDPSNWDYYMVYIKSGVEIILDLNGHVLDRSRIDLGQSTSYGWAIENKGTLTIKDSNPSTTHTLYKKAEAWRPNVYTVEDKSEDSAYAVAMTVTGGAIIGAYNSDGGGIKNTGTLTLEGGTICGNEGTTQGGGVYNQGTFTMTGGTIRKNNSTGGYKWGGGGVQNDGTFIMTGGTITENTCKNSYNQLRGGGVYNAGTFKISGSPVVAGNSNGNVFLMSFSQHNGKKIEVVGTLNEDADVGVYPEDEPPITVTTGYKTYMDGKDQTNYFSSDRAGWFVMLDSDGEVLLSKPIAVATPTITPAGGEYTEAQTVTINCETEGATIYYTTDGTDPTANSTVYTAPFTVSETTTVKALAVKETANSEIASATYTITVPEPTDPVPYVYYTLSGTTPIKHTDGNCADYTAVKSDTTEWTDGWYVVYNNVTISDRITVTGEVNLILMDGAKLTANSSVYLPQGSMLNIYGQTEGTGALFAQPEDSWSAGIGGINTDDWDYDAWQLIPGDTKYNCGQLVVHGGVIEATGGSYAAGIGGGDSGNGGVLTVYGGTVTGKGKSAAGIGGGYAASGGEITIYGGKVTGESSGNGAGIGGGFAGTGGEITINGGTVIGIGSNASAGIGTGYYEIEEMDDVEGNPDIVIDETNKVITLKSIIDLTVNGGTVTATGGNYAAGIGTGEIDMLIDGYTVKLSGSVTVNGGTVTATGGTGAAGIGGGWDTSGIDITANGGITKTAGGTLVVTDNNLQYWSAVPVGGIHDDEAQATYFYAEGIGHGVAYEDNYPRGTITLGKNMIIYGAPTVDPETSEDNVLTLTDGDYIRYQYMTIIPGAIATPTYSVTVIGGTNTTPDSETYLTQTEITGDMTTVVYTAKEGYLFPAIASAYGTFNGVTVALSANRKAITVSGTPTADVEITIPDAAQEGGTTGGDTPSQQTGNDSGSTTPQQTGNTDGSATSPQTGDNSHIGLWIAIMILSLCALAATLFIGKKKRVFDR